MAMPANVTTVTVLGTFLTPEGNPSTGIVTFTPSAWLNNPGANIAIPNSSVSKTLGTAGDFTVLLPVTDDTDLSPENWVYNVSEVIDGVSQNYNILLPGTAAPGGTAFLADLAPAAPAGPEYYSLASSLSIGTVTTVATGGSATATITGLAPSQVLSLGLPTGATGTVASAGSGSVGTAAVAATGDPNTGIYFPAADQVAITTGGTQALLLAAGAVSNPTITGVATFAAGTVSAPAITTTGDTDTGIYFPAADNVGIATAGTARVVIGSAGQITGVLGAVGSPTYSFTGDTNTGAYSPSADNYSIATAGTQRVNVDANGLITGTGTSLGAWTAYTSTLGGTGWAIGDGTASGAYCQIGKTVTFRLGITFGTTSTFGAGALTVSVPVAGSGSNVSGQLKCFYQDTSAGASYAGVTVWVSSTTLQPRAIGTGGVTSTFTTSAPFAWASTDIVYISGTYQAS